MNTVLNPKPMEVEDSSDIDKAISAFRGELPIDEGTNNITVMNKGENIKVKCSAKINDIIPEEITINDLFPNATFSRKMREAAACPRDMERVSYYVHAGIALSDELCSVWFERLGKAQAKVNADRDILSNIGALTGAVLGLGGAGSAAAGGVAAGFGFLENSFDSELANFIVAPDISVVQKAIDVDRKSRALALQEKLEIAIENGKKDIHKKAFDFYQARAELIRYDNSCSHLSVKRHVNESVSNTTAKIKKQIIALSANTFENYVSASVSLVEAKERFAKAKKTKEEEEGAGKQETEALAKKAIEEEDKRVSELARITGEKLKKVFESADILTPDKIPFSEIVCLYVIIDDERWNKLNTKEQSKVFFLLGGGIEQEGLDWSEDIRAKIKTILEASNKEGQGWLDKKLTEKTFWK